MLSQPCVVESDLRRHFAKSDAQERKNEAIDARAAELFATEYRHDTYPHIVEALGETSGEQAEAIEQAMKSADMAQLGRAIVQASASYWFGFALRTAEFEINESWCSHCNNRGCQNCEDPEK